METLTAAQARRIALTAQGFAEPRPGAQGRRVDRRHFRRVLDTVGAVQLDTVNVVDRAHYLTFFARLGPYDREALGRWLHDSHDVWEFWGHAACFLPVDLHADLRWRMEAAQDAAWSELRRILKEQPDYVDWVLDQVRQHGPLVPADLRAGPRAERGTWWDWDPPKAALEWLFWSGKVAVFRGRQFERVYDAPERVLPAWALDVPTPTEAEARAGLARRAARSMGVFTENDLIDYFHQKRPAARPAVRELLASGEMVPVEVEGWGAPAWMHPEARLPRWVRARALLAPFDSLVWERDRAHRVFDFFYRIEIYTPAPKRVHGYYVLPFLLGDRLVGRVDLKSDRKAAGGTGVLRVRASWIEPDADPDEVAPELAAELRLLAGFLGLDDVEADDRGDLAASLRLALASG
jgi:uncharacterized protein YcaQ